MSLLFPAGSLRRTPAMVVGDGLILLLSLTALTRFILRSYVLPGDAEPVLLACLLAGLLSLLVWSLPGRLPWIGAGLWTAAWAVLLWQNREAVSLGARVVLREAIGCWNNATGILLPSPEPSGLLPWHLGEAAAVFYPFVVWLFALLLGWAAVRRRGALPLLILTVPPLVPVLLAEVALDWTALAALAGCYGARLLAGQFARSSPAGGARAALAALPVTLALAVGLTALVPPEDYAPPAWAADVAEEVWEYLDPDPPEPTGAAEARPVGTIAPIQVALPSVDLAQLGPREHTGTDLFRVECDVPGALYLRVGSYTNYTRDSWLREDVGGELFDLSALFPGLAAEARGGAGHQLTVTHLLGEARELLTPYQFTDVYTETGSAADSAPATLTWSVRQDAVVRLDDDSQRSYSFRYFPLDGNPRPVPDNGDGLADQEANYYAQACNRYLAVPDATAEGLRRWREEAEAGMASPRSDGSRYGETLAQASRVVELLWENASYDLNVSAMEEGDFVLRFLESGRGYCVHFASAAALLLRLEGIPARYVEGYLTDMPESGSTLIPDSAAHAWVEIYLEGYGWYPVEATPPDGTGGQPPLPAQDTDPAEETDTPEPTDDPEDEDDPAVGAGRALLRQLLRVLAGLGTVLLLLTAGGAGLRLFRGWQWRRLFRRPDVNAAVLAAYRWLRQMAPYGAGEDETVTAAAEKARFSQHTLTEEERTAVLRALSRRARAAERGLPPAKAALFRFLFRFPHP